MKITCRCDHKFEVKLPQSQDITLSELNAALQEGTFLSVKCPECKTTFTPDFDYSLYIPELSTRFEVRSFLDRHLSEIQEGPRNKNADRLVFGIDELKEKISLLRDKLDDVIIEKIKGTFYQSNKQDYQLEYLDKTSEQMRFAVRNKYHNIVGHTHFPLENYQELLSSTDLSLELSHYYPAYVNALERKND